MTAATVAITDLQAKRKAARDLEKAVREGIKSAAIANTQPINLTLQVAVSHMTMPQNISVVLEDLYGARNVLRVFRANAYQPPLTTDEANLKVNVRGAIVARHKQRTH